MEIEEILERIDAKLKITKKEAEEDVIYIYCHRMPVGEKCRYCGKESYKIHSKYSREIMDLPIAEYKVKLKIEAKKYICENTECSHKRFAEVLPFAQERSKRTRRLDDYIREIGLKNSSVDAAEILRKTHADISNKTVLRVIKKSGKRDKI